jgi:hypothetical protein
VLNFSNNPQKGWWLGPPSKLPQKAPGLQRNPCLQVGKEVPIHMGSPEERSHEGPIGFPTHGELMSMGTSTYVKVSSFSFLHSFLLVFFSIS